MSDQFEQFTAVLRRAGQSVTKPRQIVFKALQDQEPQTMAELFSACNNQIDRASLYRTINLFEQLDITHRLQIGWKYKIELSDVFNHHHHHLTCQHCGKTIPLPEDTALEQRLRQYASDQGFVMRGHQLEIQGICQLCQQGRIA